MDPTLNKCSHQSDKKFHLIKDLQPWIEAVKELNDTLQMDRAEHHAKMEAAHRASCLRTRDERLLAEPSQKGNISSLGISNYSSSAHKDWPPKLTQEEGDLLLNNHGCLKCRRPYVFHTKMTTSAISPRVLGTSLSPKWLSMSLTVNMTPRKNGLLPPSPPLPLQQMTLIHTLLPP